MKTLTQLKLVFGLNIFILTSIISCSSIPSPELENYSRSEIDRPYTLPKKVYSIKNQFRTGSFQVLDQQRESFFDLHLPVFEISLSDSTQINLSLTPIVILPVPIPVTVKQQVYFNEVDRLGFNAGIGSFGYYEKIWLRTYFEADYRRKLANKLALNANSQYTHSIIRGKYNPLFWHIYTMAGLIFQVHPHISLMPFLSHTFKKDAVALKINGQYKGDSAGYRHTDFSYSGIGVKSVISLSQRFELIAGYEYKGLSPRDQINESIVSAGITIY